MSSEDRNAAPAAPRPVKAEKPDVAKEGIRSGVHSTRAPQTTKIATGNVVDGRYLVGEIIGTGAFGLVFAATNTELDEKVALKTMRPEIAVDTAMVARFAREAKAAASIKSEYVATVYDVGTGSDGMPYIVMEFLDGKNLGEIVETTGPIAPQKAVEYGLQICEALAVAHSKGIVHRDIKPENLLLTERAGGMHIVKVLDFGISKAALTGSIFGDRLPIVKTVNLMGTPLYMSPEQVRCSDGVDLRSDIWSLGMVLYEIIAGVTAFSGTSITEICAAILEHQPAPIENYATGVPSGLVDVIMRCLEKDVRNRYQNVAELALALMPFAPKRSRLNVERAVAVLQSAGQMDPSVKVESTMPPVSVESLQAEALLRESLAGLRPGSAPSISTPSPSSEATPAPVSAVAPAASARPATVSSAAPTSLPEAASVTAGATPQKKKGGMVAVLGLAVVAVAIGGFFVMRNKGGGAEPPKVAQPAETAAAAAPPATANLPAAATAAVATAAPAAPGAAVQAPTVAADDATANAKSGVSPAKAAGKAAAPATPWPPPNAFRGRAPAPPPPAASPAASPAAAAPPAPPAPPPPATTTTPADTATGRTFRHQL